MGLLTFNGIGVKAICAVVPHTVRRTIEQKTYFDDKHLCDFVKNTGIIERRIASEKQTSSDLCCSAAEVLFDRFLPDRGKIGALLFVSQTPDYRQPATSNVMQARLHLDNEIFTQDMNYACSGFIYGLIAAYSLCKSGIDNILLCVGDTPSKFSSLKDSSTALMFGDAGTACIIGSDAKFGNSYFSFNSDGNEFNSVNIPGGGYRIMSSIGTLTPFEDADGNEKSLEQMHMDGLSVFSYSVRAMTSDVKKILEYSGLSVLDVDEIVLHQANQFLNQKVSKKLGIDYFKTLRSIEKYGNTSSASIPLTISENCGVTMANKTILFTAIGAAFTWASGIIKFCDLQNYGVSEL